MKKYALLLVILCMFSCYKEKKEGIKVQSNKVEEEIDVEIVKVSSKIQLSKLLQKDKRELRRFFSEDQLKKFEQEDIDAFKVKDLIIRSRTGDEEAIDSLTYLYYIIEDEENLNDILKLGQRYGNKFSLYNLALLDIKNKKYDSALEILKKLPEDYKKDEINEIRSSIYLQKAITYWENRQFTMALPYFLDARKIGVKNLESYIAKIYMELNDKENAEKFLKISAKNGDISSIRDLAFLYFENNQADKAIEYFKILYYKGYVEYVLNIYLEYYKQSNIKEAVKWYKIGRRVGIIERNEKIEKLIKYYD